MVSVVTPGRENAAVSRPVPVLIVDDQAPFRRAARAVLAATPGFDPVGEAESGEQALDLVESLAPALVLMDINMPGIDGIEASRRIVGGHPGTVVFLLSTYRADDLPEGAKSCGAAGYIHKEEFGSAVLRDLWDRHGTAA
jgi:two-component system, NarL family, invasion response regulator UvrY